MTQTLLTGRGALQQFAENAYAGKTLVAMLCYVDGDLSYTSESLITEWEAVEPSGFGYARSTHLLGSVSETDFSTGVCSVSEIPVSFSAVGGSYVFDTIVLFEQSQQYPVSVIDLGSSVSLADGDAIYYRIDIQLSQPISYSSEIPVDPDYSSVRLLFSFDEVLFPSSGFESGYYKIPASYISGQSLITTKRSKFGRRSLENFNNGVTAANSLDIQQYVDLNFRDSDFTVEANIFLSGPFPGSRSVIASGFSTSYTDVWRLYVDTFSGFATPENPNGFYLAAAIRNSSGNLVDIEPTPPLLVFVPEKRWCHVAFVRKNSSFLLFVDGLIAHQQIESTLGTLYSEFEPIKIGGASNNLTYNFNGYIDNFRMTIGKARYEQTFTPPSLPHYSN